MATQPIQQNDDGSFPASGVNKNTTVLLLKPASEYTLDSATPEAGKGLGAPGRDPGQTRNIRVPYDSAQGSGDSGYVDVDYHVTETRKRAESSTRAMLTLGR